MPAPPLLLRAHAKLNLGLAVRGRRADGFHEIDTLFVRIELCDEVRLEPIGAEVVGRLERDSDTVALHDLRMDRHNLVLRAAEAYLRAAGDPGGVRVSLRKRIPVAAGLGGGSSDAAAVLRGLARLYPGAVESADLALELGSDVPFFHAGHAAARAGGRGELIEPVSLPRRSVVLANPGIAVSAADAYRLLTRFDPPLAVSDIGEGLLAGNPPSYRNSLQEGVEKAFPSITEALAELRSLGLQGVLMSGSGPTCFGLASDGEQARAAAERLAKRRPNWWVWSGEFG